MTPDFDQTNSLQGQVALVTGGAARLGAAMARALHAQGCDLLLHYHRSTQAAAALQAELETKRAASVHLTRADLTAPDAIETIEQAVREFRDRLDILVNNASTYYPTPLPEVKASDWDDLIGANLRAPFFLTQALAGCLKASRGCVVNLVDINAERPLARYPVYSIAKAGNAMMVKALARELGPEVRVNGIAPGAILWPTEGMAESAKQEILDRTALGHAGNPADIAKALLFLVRDAPYITGQIITVDGGRSLQQ